MKKKTHVFHFKIRNCFPFLKAYFSKHQTSIHSPYHHMQKLQWIKHNIQVLKHNIQVLSVDMNWYMPAHAHKYNKKQNLITFYI